MRLALRPALCALVAILAAATAAGPAAAQPSSAAARRAEALFQEGRKLVEAGRHAEACPRFEESQRLDPGLGTLLNLAACYEQIGRLASALTAFRSAEEQARAAGAAERRREQTAAERARALEGRVARLTITLASGERPPGFVVTRDGAPVPALDFGRRLAVDPGPVVIEAHAPGHVAFRVEVSFSADTRAHAVDIPALAPERASPGPGPGADAGAAGGGERLADPERPRPESPPRSGSSRKRLGLVVGGVGVVGLGAGVALGLSAKGQYDDVPCTAGDGPPTGCTPDELDRIDAARGRGNLGTIVGAVGLAAVAGGAVLWLTAPADRPVQVAPLVTDRELGVTFAGRF